MKKIFLFLILKRYVLVFFLNFPFKSNTEIIFEISSKSCYFAKKLHLGSND